MKRFYWIIIAGLAIAVIYSCSRDASAHDWYSGIRNPVTGRGCCGGADCHPLMLSELDRLTFDNENFIIDGKWFFPVAEAMPAREIKPGESGYSFCIWNNKPQCFFYPTNA